MWLNLEESFCFIKDTLLEKKSIVISGRRILHEVDNTAAWTISHELSKVQDIIGHKRKEKSWVGSYTPGGKVLQLVGQEVILKRTPGCVR
jgi:hypothetical protein